MFGLIKGRILQQAGKRSDRNIFVCIYISVVVVGVNGPLAIGVTNLIMLLGMWVLKIMMR